jgi:hypothetical protein
LHKSSGAFYRHIIEPYLRYVLTRRTAYTNDQSQTRRCVAVYTLATACLPFDKLVAHNLNRTEAAAGRTGGAGGAELAVETADVGLSGLLGGSRREANNFACTTSGESSADRSPYLPPCVLNRSTALGRLRISSSRASP